MKQLISSINKRLDDINADDDERRRAAGRCVVLLNAVFWAVVVAEEVFIA